MRLHWNFGSRVIPIVLLMVLSLTLISGTTTAPFPEVISLPDGFQPEGIASGNGTTFFAGSIPTGAVYRGDLRTGEGSVLVPGQAGRNAIGMKFDPRKGLLFVAGGPSGYAFVYDGNTGTDVAAIQLTTQPGFINDVVVTRDAAYFTNSFAPVMYRVPLAIDGSLPPVPTSQEIPLGGDYRFVPNSFNANGIDATPNGRMLIIVNSADGALYRVDPHSGVGTSIDLGGGAVPFGDGILLQGKTLYVVQNFLNEVAVVQLDSKLQTGELADPITSPLFRIPTTAAKFGSSLYVVNARFDTTPQPDTEYEIVQIPRK